MARTSSWVMEGALVGVVSVMTSLSRGRGSGSDLSLAKGPQTAVGGLPAQLASPGASGRRAERPACAAEPPYFAEGTTSDGCQPRPRPPAPPAPSLDRFAHLAWPGPA